MFVLQRGVDSRLRAALVALLFVSAACALAPSAYNAPTTLVVWVDNPAVGASVKQRLGPFLRDHPNLQVTVFDQTGKIQNGDISIAIEALANSQLSPDVVALTDQDFRLMSNQSDLLDLGPYVIEESDFATDDFFPSVMDAFREHGKQLAIPSEVVPWVVFYNKQLFDAAHVATPDLNWGTSQFVQTAQQVQQTGTDKQQVVGFVTDPTQAFLPIVESYGVIPESASDDPYAKWLDDPRTVQAAQWLADLSIRENVMPQDPNNRNLGLWFGGRAGMTAMFMDQRNMLPAYMQRDVFQTPTALASPTPPPGWKFPWGVTTLPKAAVQTSVYYVTGYAIPQESRDPDDAWLLIDFLTRNLPDQPGRAYVPARESLAYSKQFNALYPEDGRQAYLQSIQNGNLMPAWPPSANLTVDDLHGMLDGTVHPGNAIQAYRDRIQPILTAPPPPTPTVIGSS